MKRDEIEAFFLGLHHDRPPECRWQKDHWGTLKKRSNEETLRIKFNARSFRIEACGKYEDEKTGEKEIRWIRLRTGFYRQCSVTEEGKLKGLKR